MADKRRLRKRKFSLEDVCKLLEEDRRIIKNLESRIKSLEGVQVKKDRRHIRNLESRIENLENLQVKLETLHAATCVYVVYIVMQKSGDFQQAQGLLFGGGTGCIIYSGDLPMQCAKFSCNKYTFILTCAHLFEKPFPDSPSIQPSMDEINLEAHLQVCFFLDPNSRNAEVIYLDYSHDLAILVVEDDKDRPYAKFGPKFPRRGSSIFCISHPRIAKDFQELNCLSIGWLSHGLDHGISHLAEDCTCLLYDLATSQGSSGAAVYNLCGKIIAIHVAKNSAWGVGVSIHSIKKALLSLFRLHDSLISLDANDLLLRGLLNVQAAFPECQYLNN